MILLYIIAISSIIGLVTGIIKGVVHHLFGGIITFLILSLCVFSWYNHIETPQQLMDKLHEVLPKSERTAQPAQSTTMATSLFQMVMSLLQTIANLLPNIKS